MKYISILTILLFLSCGKEANKHGFIAVYEFENPQNVSVNNKQGTIQTLSKRLDKFASRYEIGLNKNEQIEIKIWSDFKKERLNSILTNQGKLELWEVIKAQELKTFVMEANNMLKQENELLNPLYDLIKSASYGYENGLFSISKSDTTLMRQYLNKKEIKVLLPSDLRNSKFLFGTPNEDDHVTLYVVKTPSNGQAMINEGHIIEAIQNYDATGRPIIGLKMNKIGSNRWERMTELAFQNQSQIAITLNNIVYVAPFVTNGAIRGGMTEIYGNFTIEEAQDLSLIFSTHNRIPKLKFIDFSPITD